MARPLSETKRAALLEAAAKLVAKVGIGATTARIAREAGLSEGTLFTYFPTKDELLNALYAELEEDLAQAMMADYPQGGAPRDCVRHAWDRFIDWGAAHPARRLALKQLKASDRITEPCRLAGEAAFGLIKSELNRSLAQYVPQGQTIAYLYAVFGGLAETTLEFIAGQPEMAERCKQSGFDILWKGITA